MLLNCRELTRYDVAATDGPIGRVSDLVIDLGTWGVKSIQLLTDGLLTHHLLHITPADIQEVEFPSETLKLRLSQGEIRQRQEASAEGAVAGQPVPGSEALHHIGANELPGFTIEAADGAAGSVSGLLVDTASWRVRYIVTDVGDWVAHQHTLLMPRAIDRIDRAGRRVVVSVTKERIMTSPPYTGDVELIRDWEAFLYDHYGWSRG